MSKIGFHSFSLFKMDDYRIRKELFVSNLSGTTLYETGSIVINICATYFLCQILKSSISLFQKYSLLNFLFEYVIIIIPMVLVTTLFSPISYILHLFIWACAFLIYLTKKSRPIEKLPTNSKPYSHIIENFSRSDINCHLCLYSRCRFFDISSSLCKNRKLWLFRNGFRCWVICSSTWNG